MIKIFAIIILGIFVLSEVYMFIFDLIDKIEKRKEVAVNECVDNSRSKKN